MADWMDKYAITGFATVTGMHQLVTFAKAIGEMRRKHGVQPPETNGPPEFTRAFRAQQNSIEFYPLALTGLWVASAYFHPVPASVAYLGHLYGRRQYFKGYCEKAEKRLPGFYLSLNFLKAIFGMCILGVGHKMVRQYANIDLMEIIAKNIPMLSN